MTTTEDALTKLSGDAFENLAAAVLRCAEPAYSLLIQTGTNPDGKTVRSAVDGIFLFPDSSPPHFVIFHFTTDQKLSRKWLHQRSPRGRGSRTTDGDVIKALSWSEQQRQTEPRTQVTLVLACNRRPIEQTVTKAGQLCFRNNMQLHI